MDTVFGGLKRILAEISSLGYLTQLVEKEVLTGNAKPRDVGVGVGVDVGVDVGVGIGLGIDHRGLGSDDVGASAYVNGGVGLTD